jgi:16S rRNA (adenine1518-N6/adenine1519-N6)-dimethyltransferase
LKAKKSFGQHFLNSPHIAQKIVDSLSFPEGLGNVLEVGPGKGVLTRFLLEKDCNFKAVEADRDMVDYLHATYPQLADAIIAEDFLKLPLDRVFEGQPFALIGNFPYNISSQIVFRMLKYRDLVPEMVGMFQKEMAERIIAPHGSKTYGVISVLTQAFYQGKYLFTVQPGSFSPPPRVLSGVIRLDRIARPELEGYEKTFSRVVKQAFSQRRKMLRNTMKIFLKDDPLLKDSYFDQRPEDLSVEDYIVLSKQLHDKII